MPSKFYEQLSHEGKVLVDQAMEAPSTTIPLSKKPSLLTQTVPSACMLPSVFV